jgi:hypothetical protein
LVCFFMVVSLIYLGRFADLLPDMEKRGCRGAGRGGDEQTGYVASCRGKAAAWEDEVSRKITEF